MSENAQSVGSHITFGKFRALHLGDLTWNKEFDLMCPQNRLGIVDLWIVSHHGLPISNSQVLAHAIQPRVAIVNNGTRKGGQPESMKIILKQGELTTVKGRVLVNGAVVKATPIPLIQPHRKGQAGLMIPLIRKPKTRCRRCGNWCSTANIRTPRD